MSESDRASEFIRPVPTGDLLAALTRDRSGDQRPRAIAELLIGLLTFGALAIWTSDRRRERMTRHEWLILATFAESLPLDRPSSESAARGANINSGAFSSRRNLATYALAVAALALVAAAFGTRSWLNPSFAMQVTSSRNPVTIWAQAMAAVGFFATLTTYARDRRRFERWCDAASNRFVSDARRSIAMPRSGIPVAVWLAATALSTFGPLWLGVWWLARARERRLLRDVWRLRLQLAERLLESREQAAVEFDIVERKAEAAR